MAEVMILGLSWLTKCSPMVHWGKSKRHIVMAGESKQQREKREGLECMKAATKLAPKEQTIPKEYQDLAEVFSEKECDVLPAPIAPWTA